MAQGMLELTVETMEAVVGGYHSAPFEVLGMHRVTADGKGHGKGDGKKGRESLVVRAFRPLDRAVWLVDVKNNRRMAMEPIHPGGLYAVHLARRKNPFVYRLLVEDEAGEQYEIEDPYRFDEEWLTEFELHLHGEGQFLRSYEKLGAHPRVIDGVAGVQFAVWAPNAERVSVVGARFSATDRFGGREVGW